MQAQRGAPIPFISALQCGMLVAGTTAITNHALAVTYLLGAGGRDAWLAGPLGMVPALVAMTALVALGRAFPDRSLVEYLPRLLGPGLGHALSLIYILYFFTAAAFTLRRTTDWLVDSILPETPAWIIAAVYLAACVYVSAGGIQTLARTNQFTLPFLTILGVVVSTLTLPAKDYGLLRPVLEQGFGSAFRAAWMAMGIFGELCILGMFLHYVRDAPRARKAVWVGVLYATVTMTGPVTGAIAALGYRQATNMPYPTYQQWLMIAFARFLERTDLLAVHQWLVGAYVRTGLFLFAVTIGIWQLFGKGRWPWLLGGGAVGVWAAAILLHPNILAFDAFVKGVYLPAGVILGIVIPPGLWVVAAVRGLTKGVARHGQTRQA